MIRRFFFIIIRWLRKIFSYHAQLKITIMSLLLYVNLYSQRTDVECIWCFISQPSLINVEANIHEDSITTNYLKIYKDSTWIIEFSDSTIVTVSISRADYYVSLLFDNDSAAVDILYSDMNIVTDDSTENGIIIGDYSVDGLDLLQLSKDWGKSNLSVKFFTDINGDGVVDGLDLIQLSKDWGKHY